jgi:hypothetical protein
MIAMTTPAPRDLCEKYLREEVQANLTQGLLPSENRVAERLLNRGDELVSVYEEVIAVLYRDGIGWKVFLGCLLSTGAFWSPEKIAESRTDRTTLIELNRDIAKQAQMLAEMLAKRDHLHNRSAFSSGTLYDIVTTIDQASASNGRYTSYLKKPLSQLNAQFDTKYWPSLAECVQALSDDAESSKVHASDPLTEAATKSSRPSKADFIRALRESIDENRGDWRGSIPKSFRLSDDAMAALANVLLDLPAEEVVDATYVKNLRHRDKGQSATD